MPGTLLTPAPGAVVAVAVTVGYLVCAARSATPVGIGRRAGVVVAGVLWLVATAGPAGALAPEDVRARAVATVLLLYLVPLGIAVGTPWRVIGGMTRRRPGPTARRMARVLLHPATTSGALLLTPWLLFLTGWLAAADRSTAVDAATGVLLVVVGAAYFHARLQFDPVPRRYPAALSLVISTVESLADGVLGLVLWAGPVLGAVTAQFPDAAAARLAQTVAAGIFWIGGDVAGLPFLVSLLLRLRAEDEARSAEIDARLDAEHPVDSAPADGAPPAGRPWWLDDPQLAERLGRRPR